VSAVAAFAVTLILAGGEVPSQRCTITPQMSYGHCVEAKARQFELSGEGADTVATAAVNACSDRRLTLKEQLASCDHDLDPEEVMKVADKKVRDVAVRVVVEIRAHRHAPQTRTPANPT
jgi:hypothetical protein